MTKKNPTAVNLRVQRPSMRSTSGPPPPRPPSNKSSSSRSMVARITTAGASSRCLCWIPLRLPCSFGLELLSCGLGVFACLQAVCCGAFYTCRFCHDEDERKTCKTTMDRTAVQIVKCLRCETEQPVDLCRWLTCRRFYFDVSRLS
eukprot:m.392007 g.392007  ORF g.392007 m.392007 type:complete len:146 (+) comp56348_c0_seq8:301-738(+)